MARYMRTDLGQGHSRLRPPIVVTEVPSGIAWHGPGLYLTRPSQPPPVKAALRPPKVVTAAVVEAFYGPQVTLAASPQPSRRASGFRGVAIQECLFRRNEVTNGGFETNTTGWAALNAGSGARSTADFKFGRASISVTTPGVQVLEGIQTNPATPADSAHAGEIWTVSAWLKGTPGQGIRLAITERNAADSSTLTESFSTVTLTGDWDYISHTRTLTNAATSRLRVKVGTDTTLATSFFVDGVQLEKSPVPTPYIETNGAAANAMGADALAGYERLLGPRLPRVVLCPELASPIRTALADALPVQTVTRRSAHSRLRPPAVVGAVSSFPGLRIKLTTPSENELRTTRRSASYRLRPPAVVTTAGIFFGPQISLAVQRRGIPKSRLAPPIVIGAAETFFGPDVRLTYSRRGKATYDLAAPLVVFVTGNLGWIGIQLALSRRPVTQPILRAPAVVTAAAAQIFFGPQTTFAYSRRGVIRSVLNPPAVVTAIVVINPGLRVKLTTPSEIERRRQRLRWALGPPAVVAVEAFFGPGLYFTRHIRPITKKSILRTPAAIAVVEAFFGPTVELAPSFRGIPKSQLSAPVVVAAEAVILYGLRVALAPSSRSVPKSRLLPPVVIGAGRVFPAIRRYLVARKSRLVQRPTLYFLRPPIVLREAGAFFGPQISLVPSRRPEVLSGLSRPTVIEQAQGAQGSVLISLAAARRPVAKSRLRPVLVVVAAAPVPALQISLVRIRPRRTEAEITPPAVVSPVLFFGPVTELAPSFRGTPKSRLEPPTVVATAVVVRFETEVHLTYSRRGRARYILRAPRVVARFFARPTVISLVPQARGKAKPKLRPPLVVRLAAEISGPEVWLTYSKRGRPQYVLQPPVVVGRAPFRGLQVHLTYSRRGKPTYLLFPVTPGIPPFRPLQIQLTRITPPPTLSHLFPPAVIGAGIAFFGPQTTLVRIKHPPVQYNLRLTLVAFQRPQGDVCGFDIAGSFTCYLEIPGSLVSETQSAGSRVEGSSQAGSKVSGSESAGGSVSGSDRKAT